MAKLNPKIFKIEFFKHLTFLMKFLEQNNHFILLNLFPKFNFHFWNLIKFHVNQNAYFVLKTYLKLSIKIAMEEHYFSIV